jgi:hypothetical protein
MRRLSRSLLLGMLMSIGHAAGLSLQFQNRPTFGSHWEELAIEGALIAYGSLISSS